MNYRSCEAINKSFIVTDDGNVACPSSQTVVKNSMQRAYVFTNLFFYDLTQREIGKLTKKINDKCTAVIASSGISENDVEKIFPSVSAQFRLEVGDNSLDPLIKTELAKTSRHLSLQLSSAEKRQLEEMYHAICETEVKKFKKAVIFTHDNKGRPYEVSFSEKYINNLPPRCRRFLKPTIKLLAYMDGLQFDQFELTPDYRLTYTWADAHPIFGEEQLKKILKSMIAEPTNFNV